MTCDKRTMRLRRLANVWIMLLVAAGLLLAPLAVPIMAKPMSDIASTGAMSDDMSMSDDMPCCPDQTKTRNCASCPFVALCTLSVSLLHPSSAAALIERHPLRTVFAAEDDQLIDGLAARPPIHPPRMIV
jgi:hypothetical protein